MWRSHVQIHKGMYKEGVMITLKKPKCDVSAIRVFGSRQASIKRRPLVKRGGEQQPIRKTSFYPFIRPPSLDVTTAINLVQE